MALKKYVKYATQSFSLPAVCIKLRELLDDYRTDADDIARLINLDPSLSAKLLRLANSALFRFPSPIESVTKAVSVVGGEALYNLVVAETARTAFARFSSQQIDLTTFWETSVFVGVLAKHLAKAASIRGAERFFVIGLLHNFAELVVAKHNPPAYDLYLREAAKGDTLVAQKAEYGFYFSECSAAILEAWRLPVTLWQPLARMHSLKVVMSELEVACLASARLIALSRKAPEQLAIVQTQCVDVLAAADISLDSLQALSRLAETEMGSLAGMLAS